MVRTFNVNALADAWRMPAIFLRTHYMQGKAIYRLAADVASSLSLGGIHVYMHFASAVVQLKLCVEICVSLHFTVIA